MHLWLTHQVHNGHQLSHVLPVKHKFRCILVQPQSSELLPKPFAAATCECPGTYCHL